MSNTKCFIFHLTAFIFFTHFHLHIIIITLLLPFTTLFFYHIQFPQTSFFTFITFILHHHNSLFHQTSNIHQLLCFYFINSLCLFHSVILSVTLHSFPPVVFPNTHITFTLLSPQPGSFSHIYLHFHHSILIHPHFLSPFKYIHMTIPSQFSFIIIHTYHHTIFIFIISLPFIIINSLFLSLSLSYYFPPFTSLFFIIQTQILQYSFSLK